MGIRNFYNLNSLSYMFIYSILIWGWNLECKSLVAHENLIAPIWNIETYYAQMQCIGEGDSYG